MTYFIEKFAAAKASEVDWLAYYAFREQRHIDDALGEPMIEHAEFRRQMFTENPLWESHLWVMWFQPDAATSRQLIATMPCTVRRPGTEHYEEHADHVEGWITVLSPYQRRGLARRLMYELLRFMQEEGKTLLSINARTVAGHAFLKSMAFHQTFLNIKQKMNLGQFDLLTMQGWLQAADDPSLGLTWEVHVGKIPLERLAQLVEPLNQLLANAPRGISQGPPLRYELQAIRDWYETMEQRPALHFAVFLLGKGNGGEEVLVGASTANWETSQPEWVKQALTGVSEAWRGKDLAKALKARMLLLLRQHLPQALWVSTYNAKGNEPILAINRQLGYGVMREIGTYQISVKGLRQALTVKTPD